MILLAIDPGGTTGWCVGQTDRGANAPPRHGAYRVPNITSNLDPQGWAFVALERFLIELCQGNHVEHIVFEEPYVERRKSLKAPPRSFRSEATRWGYPAVISMVAVKCGIKSGALSAQVWRSGFGMPTMAPPQITDTEKRRRWLKEHCFERCVALGFVPKNHDEADAIGMWVSRQNKEVREAAEPSLFDHVQL